MASDITVGTSRSTNDVLPQITKMMNLLVATGTKKIVQDTKNYIEKLNFINDDA